MALTDDEKAALGRLQRRLDRDLRGYSQDGRKRLGFRVLDRYYDGEQYLEQLGLAVPEDLRQFTTIVAWPGTQVDSLAERRQVEGFLLPGQKEADEDLWEIWQANDLDTESALARIDSMVFGRGYYCVGTGDDDEIPLVTVETPLQLTHEWSNRQRRVEAAARFYVDESGPKPTRRATLYLPDKTMWLVREGRGWVEEDVDEHELGRVPVVPVPNRQRTHNRYGLSQMLRIIGLTDAAARALTNAQIATEVMALPQRFAAGMTSADFKDENGEELTAWEAYFGSVWATANKDAKFGQFDAADLKNFTTIVSHYAQLVAGVTGLPMRYLGQLSDNPPSADGIRADESRIVKTCEAQNAAEAGALEQVMSLVDQFRFGEINPDLAAMETLFRNPATPTLAQAADATVKLRTERIISLRQARRDLGYSPAQISQMEEDDREEAADPTLDRLAEKLLNADPGSGE